MKINKILVVLEMIVFLSSFTLAADFLVQNTSNSNQNYLSVNGTSGYVGIGTTTPAAKLHIAVDSGAVSQQITTGDDSSGSPSLWLGLNTSGTPLYAGMGINFGNKKLEFSTTGSFGTYTMAMNDSNVEIRNGLSMTLGGVTRTTWPTGSGTGAFTDTGSLAYYNGGNVGIGTSSPGSFNSYSNNLVVGTGVGGEGISVYSQSNAYGTITFADGTADDYQSRPGEVIYDHSTDSMFFRANRTEVMRLTKDGRVGIGTESPTTKLDVNGSINVSGSGAALYFPDGSNMTTAASGSGIWTESGNNATYDGNVNVTGDLIVKGVNWSQSTGAIIESGSNENGSYIKYADGTMVEWGNGSKATTNSIVDRLGTSAGTTYYTSDFVTFPVEFSSTPYTVAGGSTSAVGYRAQAASMTTSGFSAVLESGSLNGDTVYYTWIAYGRWTDLNLGSGSGGNGGIVNTITNENGTCTQYSNGVMECYLNITSSTVGSNVYANFPTNFTETPTTSCSGIGNGYTTIAIDFCHAEHGYHQVVHVSSANTPWTVDVVAIGRWTNSTNVNTPDYSTWGLNSSSGDIEVVNTSRDVSIPGNLSLGSGKIRYNDTSNSYEYYNGSVWQEIGTGTGESIWTNVSGTATYEGNANITGDLIVKGVNWSQSTGAIIESGGNDSVGYYIKYADGTMVQWRNNYTQYGRIWEDFIVPFSSSPSVMMTINQNSAGYVARTDNINETGYYGTAWDIVGAQYVNSLVNFYAIGRWTDLNLGSGSGGNGGIVNTITNGDGTCTQYSNGVMECYGDLTVDVTLGPSGGKYYRYISQDFPTSFIEVPSVSSYIMAGTTSAWNDLIFQEEQGSGSTTSSTLNGIISSTTSTGSVKVTWAATGRWTNSTNVNTPDVSTWGLNSSSGDIEVVNTSRDVSIPGNLSLGSGKIRYNDTSNSYEFYNGSVWQEIGTGTGASIWTESGNNATYDGNVNVTGDLIVGGDVSSSGTSRVRATSGNSQSLSSGLGTLIYYNTTENFDTLGEFNGTHFVAREAGYYLLNAKIRTSSVIWQDGERAYVYYIRSDGPTAVLDYDEEGSTDADAKYIDLEGSDILNLSAGEEVSIHVWHDHSSAITLDGSEAFNYFSIIRLHSPAQIGGDSMWTNSSNNATYIDGRVGIGTTSPTTKLDVNGSINISGAGAALYFPDGSNMTTAASGTGSSGDSIWTNSSGNATFTSGRVGIGTTEPREKLEVNGTLQLGEGKIRFNESLGEYEIYNGSEWMEIRTGNDIWENKSSVPTYDGDVNVTGGLTLGEGKIRYNSTLEEYEFYNGSVWSAMRATQGNVPAGAVVAFDSATCPEGWIEADGTSGTPDLRGIFVRGAGTSGSYSMANGTAFKATYGQYMNDRFQGHIHSNSLTASVILNLVGSSGTGTGSSRTVQSLSIGNPTNDGTNGVPRTGAETAPASYALTYCVKTANDVNTTEISASGNNVYLTNISKNFGIGTTSPREKLEVNGTLQLGEGKIRFNESLSEYQIYNGTSWTEVRTGDDLWENKSSVPTYDGDVNVTGGLTLGEGKIRYNSTLEEYEFYNGSVWRRMKATGGNVPAGAVVAFDSATCPEGWIEADGTSGTPDLRGIFVRGAGTSGSYSMANGTNFSATYGEYMNDSMQGHIHTFSGDALAAHSHNSAVSAWGDTTAGSGNHGYIRSANSNIGTYSMVNFATGSTSAGTPSGTISNPSTEGTYGTPRTGAETAPASYALTYCVKTSDDTINTTGAIGTLDNNRTFVQNVSHNFGIGTTSPREKLEVNGTLQLGEGKIRFNESWGEYEIYNGSEWMEIRTGDDLWENKSSVPTYDGDVNVTGNLTLGEGKIRYNSTLEEYEFYNGSVWRRMKATGGNVPAGAVVAFDSVTCPEGWIEADGNSGTPDLRGIFVRGAGTSGSYTMANGTSFSATYGEYMNDSMQGHIHGGIVTNAGPTWTFTTGGGWFAEWGNVGNPVDDGTNGVPRTGAETRPASYALTYCVKTSDDTTNTTGAIGTLDNNRTFVQNVSHNFGIGTTNPREKLEVNGTLQLGEGKIRYNSTSNVYEFYNGSVWKEIGADTSNGYVPAGAVVAFDSATCPVGWVEADGTSGTPDLRGIFVRGAGTNGVLNMANGTSFSATFGEYMNDSMQGHIHTYSKGDQDTLGGSSGTWRTYGYTTTDTTGPKTDGTNGVPRTGGETAPASYALTYCIKTADNSNNSVATIGTLNDSVYVLNTTYNFGVGTTKPNSKLQVNGSVSVGFKSITADRTLDWTDSIVVVNATLDNVTVTLPTAVNITGRTYSVKKIDSSSNKVIIEGFGSETIDLALNLNISSQFKSYDIVSDGANWWIV